MPMPMDIEAYVDAQCALLGLTLSAAQRPGVVRYFQLVANMAPRVMDFAAATLGPADESGNTFVPVPVSVPGGGPGPGPAPAPRSER